MRNPLTKDISQISQNHTSPPSSQWSQYMNLRTLRSAGLALCLSAALHADTTFTFQNGANGYSASGDFSINTQYAQYNGGNGIQWRGDAELGCYVVTGTGGYSV